MQTWKKMLTRRLFVAVATVLLVGTFATYEFSNSARAAAIAPAAAPLDDNSVGAILTLDHAMETLAARVTPAVVNVTVTSKPSAQQSGDDSSQDMQQFFGPGFGQFFGPHGRPQPQIEHGIGSGVIISPDGYIVTNNHVIDGAVDIRVTMSNRKTMKATLIGADPLTDLAVLKVDGGSLPSIPLGDSTAVISRSQTSR